MMRDPRIEQTQTQVARWYEANRLKLKMVPLVKPDIKSEVAKNPLFAPFLLLHFYNEKRPDLFKYWVRNVHGLKDGIVPIKIKTDAVMDIYDIDTYRVFNYPDTSPVGLHGLSIILDYLAEYSVYANGRLPDVGLDFVYILDKCEKLELDLNSGRDLYKSDKLRLLVENGHLVFLQNTAYDTPASYDVTRANVSVFTSHSEYPEYVDTYKTSVYSMEADLYVRVHNLLEAGKNQPLFGVFIDFALENKLFESMCKIPNLFELFLQKADHLQQSKMLAISTGLKQEHIYLHLISRGSNEVKLDILNKELSTLITSTQIEELELPML